MSAQSTGVGHRQIMGEIYSSLVIQNVLGNEIRTIETAAKESSDDLERTKQSLEMALEATDEALRLAEDERRQRMHASTKLKLLQAERSAEVHVMQELEQTKTKLATVERELRGALAKAQSATQRQAASTHSLKLERQNARLMRRNLAAGRLVALAHSASWSSAHRCLLKWSGFCALSPPAPPARPSAHDAHAHERAKVDAHVVRQRYDSAAFEAHTKVLAAREAECARLREQVTMLHAKLQLEGTRDEALRAAADRAASASGELLAVRRHNCELVAELAAARTMIEQSVAQRRRSLESVVGPILVDARPPAVAVASVGSKTPAVHL